MPSTKLKEPVQISTKVDILDIQVTLLDEVEKNFFFDKTQQLFCRLPFFQIHERILDQRSKKFYILCYDIGPMLSL